MENTYTFEVPDGIDEVLLVIKGDTDPNGRVSQADSTKIKAVLAGVISAFWDW